MPPRKRAERPNTTAGVEPAEEPARPVGSEDLPAAKVKGERRMVRPKTPEAEALQWTGENIEEVQEFAGKDPLGEPAALFGHFWDGEVLLTVHTGQSSPRVWIGDWIVKSRDGGLQVVSTMDLEREFEAA